MIYVFLSHRSLQGMSNLPMPRSDNSDIRGFTKIPVNESDDEDSDEIHAELPVETTFGENSNDNDFDQELSGNHQEHHSTEHVQEYHHHQSQTNGGITIKTHYDN